jgi:hypothetical protein
MKNNHQAYQADLGEGKKILSIHKPLLSAYKHHALPLAILQNDNKNDAWIYSNFIQLYAKPYKYDVHWLDFYLFDSILFKNYAPWLTVQNMTADLISQISTISHFVKNCIDNGNYVYINYESFFLPNNLNYQAYHAPNNLLIVGYDSLDMSLYILDYAYTTSRKLELLKMPMDKIEAAFLHNRKNRWARVLTYNKDYEAPFKIEKVIALLQDYIHAKDSSCTYKVFPSPPYEQLVYGVEVYNELEQFCTDLMNGKAEFNLLPFCILVEHKKVLNGLIQYLIEHSFIKDQQKSKYLQMEALDIENTASTIRNTVMKAFVTTNTRAYAGIIKNVVDLHHKEVACMTRLLNEL